MPIKLDGSSGITPPSWTTATRPVGASNGQIGFNSTTGYAEYYNQSSNTWITLVPQEVGSIIYSSSPTSPDSSYLPSAGASINASSYPLLSAKIASNSPLRIVNTAIIDRYAGVTAPAGTSYTADSAIDAGRTADKAFDGSVDSTSGCWHTTNKAPPYYIRVTFTAPQIISYWDWQKRAGNDAFPLAWSLKGSNDGGSTWTSLYSKTGDGSQNSGSWNINTFNNSSTYTVYQMDVSATSGNAYCMIGEIRCGTIADGSTIRLPNFSNTLPSGMYAHIKVQ